MKKTSYNRGDNSQMLYLTSNHKTPNYKREQGFTLIEMIVTVVILGVATAIASPSLINSWRQSKANEASLKLKTTLQQAQANANRMSISCTVTLDNSAADVYTISSSTSGCIPETITVDKDYVEITSTGSGSVTFTFKGTTTSQQTFTIARKNGSGTVDSSNANCLVISTGLGLIRSGKKDGSNCLNIENLRYEN